ncbi:MAG: hypothetical protein PHH43_04645 [Candidatus Cloacimonetes bacterium]|nr:hypothetical protein [Candidatus Cloacimonadota bacterium]
MPALKLKKPHTPKEDGQSCSRRSPEAPQSNAPRLSANPVISGGTASAATTALLTTPNSQLTAYLPTPRHAVDYIMDTFPIVKRKDERDYGEYRTKLRILEIYDQMTHCLATNTEYRSTLNPPPGLPCDKDGNFIPVEQWEINNWPKHIHVYNSNREKSWQ